MNLFDEQQYEFAGRHIGTNEAEKNEMLKTIGISTLDALIDKTSDEEPRELVAEVLGDYQKIVGGLERLLATRAPWDFVTGSH